MSYLLWGILGYGIYNILNSKAVQSQDTIPTETGKHVVLENAKYNYFASPDHAGNPRAKNIFGEGKFNYQNTIQNRRFEIDYFKAVGHDAKNKIIQDNGISYDRIRHISEKELRIVGLECNAVSVLTLYKSLGLITPSWTANRFEKEFTNIFIDADLIDVKERKPATNKDYSIDPKFNAALRGIKEVEVKKFGLSYTKLTNEDYRIFAEKLSTYSVYASRTGMTNKKFAIKNFSKNDGSHDYAEMEKYIKIGNVIRLKISYYGDSHYVVMTDISLTKNQFICDDSLNGIDVRYSLNDIQEAWTLDVV